MSPQARENGAVRVSPMDQRGRPISPGVLSAAEEVRVRAIHHAERLLVDPAVAANLLEEAAATVSRALRAKSADDRPVQDLESYLFRAFLRRLNKAKKRQSLLSDNLDSDAFLSRISCDPRRSLEMKIFIDELLTQSDPLVRDMLFRRLSGCSWAEVGLAHQISGHAAESKFSQALQKIRKKLRSR